MFPADRNPEPVSVEYDCRGGRSTKTFADPYKARSFYVSKFKSGHKPTVHRSDIMATKKTAKKSTKKTATPKKAAKTKKAAKVVTPKKRGDSIRLRAVKAIAKKDMTAAEVQTAVCINHGLKPTLDQEVKRGHLRYAASKNERTQTYSITAAGKKAIANGTVDPKRTSK